jgi:hypothetical protein
LDDPEPLDSIAAVRPNVLGFTCAINMLPLGREVQGERRGS